MRRAWVAVVGAGYLFGCGDAQPGAATAPSVQPGDACPPTRACGGDAVGAWRIVSLCTRAPELLFEAFTRAPGSSCRAEVRAADLRAEGRLDVPKSFAIDLDYTLSASLELAWPARCLGDGALEQPRCSELETTLREQVGVTDAACQLREAECGCSLGVELAVQAQNVERARDVFVAGEHCVNGQRLALDDGATSLVLERAGSQR